MNFQQNNYNEEKPQGRSMALHQAFHPSIQAPVQTRANASLFRSSTRKTTVPKHGKNSVPVSRKSFDGLLHRLTPQVLPDFATLGHCTITFDANEQPTVLRRICAFIKKCSLDFQVVPEEGRIDCRAPCLLSFCIWIWSDESNDSIIVELQRRQGCGVTMQRVRKAFTRFMQTGADFDPHTLGRCHDVTPHMRTLYQSAKNNRTDALSSSSSSQSTLERCHGMLESEVEDQKQLGMENLLFILSSSSVAQETKRRVSEAILWEQTDDGNISLLDEISFYFIGNHKRPFSDATMDDTCNFEEYEFAEGRSFGVMHNLALRVLLAALSAIVHADDDTALKKHAPLDVTKTTWKTIIGALCYNICHAETRPQEAAWSARCLVLLDQLSSCPSANQVITYIVEYSNQVLPCLFAAQSYGNTHNETLSVELRSLLARIQQGIE